MKPDEVPTELVSEAVDVWRMQDGSVLDGIRNVLAAVLPAHEAMVRAKVIAGVRHYFAASDDPLYDDVRILCGRIGRGEY